MKLLVVILCYRVPELTIDCLKSLSGEIARVPDARVALCENGTGRESAEMLRQAIASNGWGSWVELTVVERNLGFTGGNNLVIRRALASDEPPEYILLLNSDTIVHEDAVASLVRFMDEHPTAGIAGSQLRDEHGEIKEACPFRFEGIATELDRGMKLQLVSRLLARWTVIPRSPKPTTPALADWVSGASMILRRSMLDEIGLLDEGLYTYFDDIDICLRAKRAGWETWFVPESNVVHLGGSSTNVGPKIQKRRPDYWHQARRRFFLKNYGPFYTACADAAFLLGFASWRLRRRIQGKPDTDPPHLLVDSFRHSVFRTGFRVGEVENPLLKETVAEPKLES